MKPKLLAPAGNIINLKAAIDAGCDEVYFGVKELNMRNSAKNFELKDLKKTVDLCHKNNVKAFLTLNTIIYQNELTLLEKIIKKAKQANIDAIICWDFAVIKLANKYKIPVHLSTQASVSNYESAEYFHKQFKVQRIVLARECTLSEITKIIRKIKENKLKLEIETFIHGALCISVSGRCFMSQDLLGKSANRGECTHLCRREYNVKDGDIELKLENNHVMSPKDLCTLPFLDKLIKANINSFKIEGRARSPEYVHTVVSVYREYIDKKETNIKKLIKKLKTVYNRGFSNGYYMGRKISDWTDSQGNKATKKRVYIGKVTNYYSKHKAAEIKIESLNLKIKDDIQIEGPTTGLLKQKIKEMQIHNKAVKKAEKCNVAIKVNKKVRENDKVYKIVSV